MEYAYQFKDYLIHPEIYARHIDTTAEAFTELNVEVEQKLQAIRDHPIVRETEEALVGAVDGEDKEFLFTEQLVSFYFWVMECSGLSKPGDHYRVEPGQLEL